ncbi:MAG: ATP-binding protein [Candidatus Hodarchaeales archaeon]
MASGKGGTGKTTIAVNLALYLSRSFKVALFDLDVEEPNDNHFLHYDLEDFKDITIKRPTVDETTCTHCGLCADLCEFNALAVLPNQVMVFEELCHGCGLCTIACPQHAISEHSHKLGTIKRSYKQKNNKDGSSEYNLTLFEGELKVGEALATPIIHELKKLVFSEKYDHIILDLPPGSSCPVIEALTGTDFSVLVTEPTPAGEHDLRIAVEVVKQLKLPFGIVNNRSNVGDDRIKHYTSKNNYQLLLELPHSTEIINLYSRGLPLIGNNDKFDKVFQDLWNQILEALQ